MAYVRDYYNVPAIRGGVVFFREQKATILSATHHLHVRFDDGGTAWIHPKCEVRYEECPEAVADREGHEEPCNRSAVGYRYDPEFVAEGPYPVCRRHHREPFTAAEAANVRQP